MRATTLLLSAALLAAGCAAEPAPAPVAATGSAPPAFRLPSVDGAEMALADALKTAAGKPLVLVLGSASCSFSTQEVSELAETPPAYHVVAVVEGSAAEVKASLPKSVPFPVLVDTGGRTLAAYSVGATPSVVLLDGKGAVAYQGEGGYIPPTQIAEMADKVSRGEPVGPVATAGG